MSVQSDPREYRRPEDSQVESMFYYGEVPWHGLGVKVEGALTSEEAIVKAGLNWEVRTTPVFCQNAQGRIQKIPGRMAVQRMSDGRVYTIAGMDYKPVQNIDAFKFFDGVVGEKAAMYHTAGSLKYGGRVWILAKLPEDICVAGEQVEKYLLLMNGHDGKMALKMFFTPIRVVCRNTLRNALEGSDAADRFYARHTAGVDTKVESAREILKIAKKFYDKFGEQAQYLATKKFTDKELPLLLAAAFKPDIKMLPAADPKMYSLPDFSVRTKGELDKVRVLIHSGTGQDNPKIQDTAWQAYNGIVEYVDYGKQYGGSNPENLRLQNVWGGNGLKIKERAFDYLLKC